MLWQEIKSLVFKELMLELRQKYAISGMLLYLSSSIFIGYVVFNLRNIQMNPNTWNALYWIIMLFAAVNSTAKSFIQESKGRLLYYYTIASPQGLIISKIIYNSLLMSFLVILGYLIFALFLGNPVGDMLFFLIVCIVGAVGFATTFTMISSIASKASNSSTLMAILGFPVIIPVLLLLIKTSKYAIDGLDRSLGYDELLTIAAIIVISITTSILLFPYLWRSN